MAFVEGLRLVLASKNRESHEVPCLQFTTFPISIVSPCVTHGKIIFQQDIHKPFNLGTVKQVECFNRPECKYDRLV